MQRSDLKHMDCSVAQTLNILADHWSFLILRNCFHGMRNFDAFQSDLGISPSLLSTRLKHMTKSGILDRRQSARDGRAFEYRLTEQGLELYPIIVAMMQWGDKWAPGGTGPRLELLERATGLPIQGTAVLAQDGRHLSATDVVATPGPGSAAG